MKTEPSSDGFVYNIKCFLSGIPLCSMRISWGNEKDTAGEKKEEKNLGEAAQYAIKMHHVTKTFGKVVANKNVDLELKTGEILALLGENGSGKTRRQFLALEVLSHQNYLVHSRLLLSSLSLSFSTWLNHIISEIFFQVFSCIFVIFFHFSRFSPFFPLLSHIFSSSHLFCWIFLLFLLISLKYFFIPTYKKRTRFWRFLIIKTLSVFL